LPGRVLATSLVTLSVLGLFHSWALAWPPWPRQLVHQPYPQADTSIDVALASVRLLAVLDGLHGQPMVVCGSQPLPLDIGSLVLMDNWVHSCTRPSRDAKSCKPQLRPGLVG
jgi:hypothetical protein